jgi:hypothetical protein
VDVLGSLDLGHLELCNEGAGLRWVLAVELGAALTLGSGPGCAAGQQNHENVAVNP